VLVDHARRFRAQKRGGGGSHLDVPGTSIAPIPGQHVPLHRTVDIELLAREMTGYRLRLDEVHTAEEEPGGDPGIGNSPWPTADGAIPTTRMVVSWQRATR